MHEVVVHIVEARRPQKKEEARRMNIKHLPTFQTVATADANPHYKRYEFLGHLTNQVMLIVAS
jgi:hypothetical protein